MSDVREGRWWVALVAAVVLLAGCGGGDGGGSSTSSDQRLSAPEYRAKIQTIGDDFRGRVSDAQAALSTNAERVKGLQTIRAAFSDVAGRIAGLRPPADAQDEQDRLVTVLRRGATDLGTVQAAITRNDVAAIRSAAQKIKTDSTDAGAALNDLKTAVGG